MLLGEVVVNLFLNNNYTCYKNEITVSVVKQNMQFAE